MGNFSWEEDPLATLWMWEHQQTEGASQEACISPSLNPVKAAAASTLGPNTSPYCSLGLPNQEHVSGA